MSVVLRIRRKGATQAEDYALLESYTLEEAQLQVNTAIERGVPCSFALTTGPLEFDPKEVEVVSVTLDTVQSRRLH